MTDRKEIIKRSKINLFQVLAYSIACVCISAFNAGIIQPNEAEEIMNKLRTLTEQSQQVSYLSTAFTCSRLRCILKFTKLYSTMKSVLDFLSFILQLIGKPEEFQGHCLNSLTLEFWYARFAQFISQHYVVAERREAPSSLAKCKR